VAHHYTSFKTGKTADDKHNNCHRPANQRSTYRRCYNHVRRAI